MNDEITKEEFEAYEAVRSSGVTNMFAVNVVSELSGLSRDRVMKIMREYQLLMDKYPEVRKLWKYQTVLKYFH